MEARLPDVERAGRGRSWMIVVVVGLAVVLAWVGWGAGMNRRAMLSQVAGDVDRIVTAQRARDAAGDPVLLIGSREEAEGIAARSGPRNGEPLPEAGWTELGFEPEALWRCGYWVDGEDGALVAHALCDIDRDGVYAEYEQPVGGKGAWLTGRFTY